MASIKVKITSLNEKNLFERLIQNQVKVFTKDDFNKMHFYQRDFNEYCFGLAIITHPHSSSHPLLEYSEKYFIPEESSKRLQFRLLKLIASNFVVVVI